MLPILQVGPLSLPLAPLSLLAGLWLATWLAERYAARFGVNPDRLSNLIWISLLAALAGARLAYVLRYPQAFAGSPASVLSLNPGLLDPLGAAAGALIAALAYGQRRGMTFWPTLDAITPGLAVMGVTLGLSHLASGAAFGAPTGLPWGVELWGAVRHPSQVYEMLAALIILIIVWPGSGLAHRAGAPELPEPPGALFLRFVALSAAARLFLEAFRGDSLLLPGGLRLAQVAAWVILAAALWGLNRLPRVLEGVQAGEP